MGWYEKHWSKLLLGLILYLAVLVNFRWGYFIIGNDNYSPEENPAVSVDRYIENPAWRSYRGLGVPSDSEQIDLSRSLLLLGFSKLGVPLWFLSQILVMVCLVTGPWFAGLLVDKMIRKKEKGVSQWVFILSALTYFSSFLTLWLFYSPLKPFIFAWAFLPLFLWAGINFSEKASWKNFMVLIVAIILVTHAFVIPTLFIVIVGLITLFFLAFVLLGVSWKKILLTFLIFMFWQFFWLLPFGSYVGTNSKYLEESFINKWITPGTIEDEYKYNTLENVTRFETAWIDMKNDHGENLFQFSQWYKNNPFLQAFSWVPTGLAVLGLVIALWKRRWAIVLVAGLYLVGVWMIKARNPPLAEVYVWLQDNIPLFRQVFRWGSSKFWPYLLLPQTVLAGMVVARLSSKKIFGQGMCLILLVGSLIYIFPVYLGKLINEREYVAIPQEYKDLKEVIGRLDKKGRVLIAPESNMLYFRNYKWGFFGSVFWNYFVPNPIIEKALITGSKENEDAYKLIWEWYYAEDPELFYNVLKNYKVKWIIGDKNISCEGNGYCINWDVFERMISNNPGFELKWQKEGLFLYKIKDDLNGPTGGAKLIYGGHDDQVLVRNKMLRGEEANWIYEEGKFDGEAAAIYPLALKVDDWSWIAEGLEVSHKYLGRTGEFWFNKPQGLNDEIEVLIRNQPVYWNQVVNIVTGETIKVRYKGMKNLAGAGKVFGSSGEVRLSDSGAMEIINSESTSGMYWELSLPELRSQMLLMAVEGRNYGGIPFDVNFRETKKDYQLFSYRVKYLGKDKRLFWFTPSQNEWKNYLLETIVYARGRDISRNRVEGVGWMGFDREWFKAELIPVSGEVYKRISGINQAKHLNWQVEGGSNDKVVINGWEEGVEGEGKEVFLPNKWTWWGWGFNLGIVVIGSGWIWLNRKKVLPAKK